MVQRLGLRETQLSWYGKFYHISAKVRPCESLFPSVFNHIAYLKNEIKEIQTLVHTI